MRKLILLLTVILVGNSLSAQDGKIIEPVKKEVKKIERKAKKVTKKEMKKAKKGMKKVKNKIT